LQKTRVDRGGLGCRIWGQEARASTPNRESWLSFVFFTVHPLGGRTATLAHVVMHQWLALLCLPINGSEVRFKFELLTGKAHTPLFTSVTNPYAARQSRTQSGATHYDPDHDYNNYCFITSSGAIASVSAAMGYRNHITTRQPLTP
jgi:hypothetical protein